ncbi:PEP/pyruvate-binding domain-containing protein [Paraburkholderia sp. MM5477-R1]|uniref:PEP/pyruvate-binding domain-containing protein n=1 Tax=Paraburkholderia sp. MM5477-R1 TaxID=2991062 RepID=UPI003D1F518D
MNKAPFILWLDDKAASGSPLLGGKFASLAEMTTAGFSVPPGFGVTTAAYRHFMAENGLTDEARRISESCSSLQLSEIKGETAHLLERIANAPMPADLEAQIRQSYAELEERTGVPTLPVAVRSSGESEDLAGASFAGQYDTFLWICGADAVLEHIRACWAGMFGEAVLSYRVDGQTVIATGDYGMCVGIQQMVQARAAGVMFTLNPLNGDRSKVVMEAVWGLGEGVVKGDITPAQFVVDKVTMEVVGRKWTGQTEEYRFVAELSTVDLVPIASTRINVVCLEDDQVRQLAMLAKHIERVRGAPQDIEWALNERGDLRVLQVRPETVWSRREVSRLVTTARSPVGHVLARLSGTRVTRQAAGGEEGKP